MTKITASVLTVRQPWASAIAYGGKDLENRSYEPIPKKLRSRISYPFPVFVHAAKGPLDCNPMFTLPYPFRTMPTIDNMVKFGIDKKHFRIKEFYPRGAIIAVAEITGLYRAGDTGRMWWAPGQIGWLLGKVRPIIPIPWARGTQRFLAGVRHGLDVEFLEGVK